MQPIIYFDYASSFPPAPEALTAMKVAAESSWGPHKALHPVAARARHALDRARTQVAEYIGAMPQEVVFVGSGREALSRAFDLAMKRLPPGGRIVSSRLEHPAMIALVERAAASGHDVRWLALPAGHPNEVDAEALRDAALVALSTCNHELGTVLDIRALTPGALRVMDAVQSAPWLPLDSWNDDRTFYAFSGSKLGAPMGIGVLRVPIDTYFAERERDADVEGDGPPWLMAIGLGAVCAARGPRRGDALEQARKSGERLLEGLLEIDADLIVNGYSEARLGTILNVSFPGVFGKSFVSALALQGICISHTAACQASRSDVSPVVRAAYPETPDRAEGATRWSVSEHVTDEDIEHALRATRETLRIERRGAR